MNWIREHRPSPGTALGLAALVVALGGVAFAAIPDSNGTIHGCYQKGNGNLRVVESSSDCRNSEQALAWNQQGPPGEASGAHVLKPFSLALGDRRVLFQAGTVTFTATCVFSRQVFPTTGEYLAGVEVTTSQDHAAVEQDSGYYTNRNLLVGQTWKLAGIAAQPDDANIFDFSFTADSPDGTNVTGI